MGARSLHRNNLEEAASLYPRASVAQPEGMDSTVDGFSASKMREARCAHTHISRKAAKNAKKSGRTFPKGRL